MRAMVLAAGAAPRLYPLTYALPMPMVPVANRPLLEHTLLLLERHGSTEVTVNLHTLPRLVTERFDKAWEGVRLHYSLESELLGTAGGVKRAAEFFADSFLVIGSDALTDIDLRAVLDFHRSRQALATVALVARQDCCEFGVVEAGPDGRILNYREKPADRSTCDCLCSTGIYVFEPEIFRWIPEGPCDFARQVFPRLVREGLPFYGVPLERGYWRDVGDLHSYQQAHQDVLEGRLRLNMPGQEVQPLVWLEEGAVLSPEASVTPPVLIGRGARVEACARLQGPVVLGQDCLVEHGARVTGSVIWDHTRINRDADVRDSLVGAGCVLEGGHRYRQVVLGSGSRFSFKTPESVG